MKNENAAKIAAEIAARLAAIDPLDVEKTINVLVVKHNCLMSSLQAGSWRDAVTRVLRMADQPFSGIAENDPVFMADASNPSREQHTVGSLRRDRVEGII